VILAGVSTNDRAVSHRCRALTGRGSDVEGLCQLVEGHNGRITTPPLQAAELLLAEAGAFLYRFLGESLLAADAREVAANQLPYIHADKVGRLHT
jgi:hypothetical protein